MVYCNYTREWLSFEIPYCKFCDKKKNCDINDTVKSEKQNIVRYNSEKVIGKVG